MTFRTLLSLAVLCLWLSVAATAHGYDKDGLKIGHPWTRATPPDAKVAGGFFTITNSNATLERLISATFSAAGQTQIHRMSTGADGVMKMEEIQGGIAIAPGQTVEFKPGGLHVMGLGLTQALKEGQMIKGTLTFEKAGQIDVEFKVEGIGAKTMDHDHSAMHK